MSTVSYPMADTATMLRRNLRHALRYPGLSLGALGMPVIMMLLFGLVFGDTFAAGLGGGNGFDYIDFLTPGILLMSIASRTMSPAVGASMDMTEGIVAGFRTMAIFRPAVLTGHVLGNVILTIMSLALVVGFAVLIGFRPNASVGDWLLASGLLIALTVALTWFAIALGLTSKTPEGEQHRPADQPAAALPEQHLHPTGVDAERHPLVRRVPAVHRHHRHPAPPAAGHADGPRQRLALHRLVPGHRLVGYFWAQKSYNKGTVA